MICSKVSSQPRLPLIPRLTIVERNVQAEGKACNVKCTIKKCILFLTKVTFLQGDNGNPHSRSRIMITKQNQQCGNKMKK